MHGRLSSKTILAVIDGPGQISVTEASPLLHFKLPIIKVDPKRITPIRRTQISPSSRFCSMRIHSIFAVSLSTKEGHRPLGQVLDSGPIRPALLFVSCASPCGSARFSLFHKDCRSESVSTLFTHERRLRGRGAALGIASHRDSSDEWRRTQAEIHFYSSADAIRFARNGFRST